MDCQCKGKFWIGLGLGAVLGAVACCLSKTQRAKELKEKVCCAAQSAAEKAGEWVASAKDKVTESE